MCSFFMAFDCPKNFRLIHCAKYIKDLGVGMILKGGGAVAPSSKKLFCAWARRTEKRKRKEGKKQKKRKFKLKKLSKCGWVTFSQRAFTCLIHSLDLANFHSISARSYIGLMICERQECEPRGRRAADMKQKKQKRYGKRWNKIYIF